MDAFFISLSKVLPSQWSFLLILIAFLITALSTWFSMKNDISNMKLQTEGIREYVDKQAAEISKITDSINALALTVKGLSTIIEKRL